MDHQPSLHPMSDLAILLVNNELMVWQLPEGSAPLDLQVQGQARLPVKAAETLTVACVDVETQLHNNGVCLEHIQQVHYLADAKGRMLVNTSVQKTEFPKWSRWQLLAAEWLNIRFGLGNAPLNSEVSWLRNELLPWLITADTTSERRQMQQALQIEHRHKSEHLTNERLQFLQQENERLRAQNSAVQQLDTERLVTFLPALYPRVFTVLGSTDLALLCGRVEPLPIPNPFPEPSEETLRTLQRNFRALPLQLQQQIVGFVAGLPQQRQLQVRPEMRELVHKLIGQ